MNTTQIIADFHESARSHGRDIAIYLERAFQSFQDRGIDLPFTDKRFPITPALVPEHWITTLEQGCRAVFEGIDILFQVAFAADVQRLADFLKLTDEEQSLYHIGHAPYDWATIARPDFMAWNNRLAIVETNITTSIGLLADGDMLRQITSGMPVFSEIAQAYGLYSVDPIAELCRTIRASVDDVAHKLVALVEWEREIPKWHYYYTYLAQELTRHGISTTLVTMESLTYTGEGVYSNGLRIDAMYRFFTTVEFRHPPVFHRYEALFAAIQNQQVQLIGNFAHKLFTPKMFLALLSDEIYRDHLPVSMRQHLEVVVPWTRLVAERFTSLRGEMIDLLPYVSRHKNDFVLKPNLGFGGERVMIGCDVSSSMWESALNEALQSDEHWLIQERIPIEPVDLAFCIDGEIYFESVYTDYGVFMLNRRFAGIARRNSTPTTGGRLTNLSRGGGLGFAFFMP